MRHRSRLKQRDKCTIRCAGLRFLCYCCRWRRTSLKSMKWFIQVNRFIDVTILHWIVTSKQIHTTTFGRRLKSKTMEGNVRICPYRGGAVEVPVQKNERSFVQFHVPNRLLKWMCECWTSESRCRITVMNAAWPRQSPMGWFSFSILLLLLLLFSQQINTMSLPFFSSFFVLPPNGPCTCVCLFILHNARASEISAKRNGLGKPSDVLQFYSPPPAFGFHCTYYIL